MAYDVSDFDREVLEASRRGPVVVDFWAAWCGPCRFLGPVLEKLESEAGGKWTLAKLNTDQFPEVSTRYGIRGIPAVKLFVDGSVTDEFTGALPEHAVRQWLDKSLPSEGKKRLAQAELKLAEGDLVGAERLLREALQEEPENPLVRVLLAQVVLWEEPALSLSLIGNGAFAGAAMVQAEEAIGTIARLLMLPPDGNGLADGPGRRSYLQGVAALRSQDFDAALTHFIEVIQTNRFYDEDGARRACIAIFTLLGEQHETTRKCRRKFDMALY